MPIIVSTLNSNSIPFYEGVRFKLDASKHFLNKLEQLEQTSGSLANAKRELVETNLDAFLYEIVGAFDAQLQVINVIFKLLLSERDVKIKSLICKLPDNSQAKKKLANIDGWFWLLREYRNHSAHRKLTPFYFEYVEGCKSPTLYLHKDPLDTSKGKNNETVIQYCQNSIKRMEQLIDEIYTLSAIDLSSSKP